MNTEFSFGGFEYTIQTAAELNTIINNSLIEKEGSAVFNGRRYRIIDLDPKVSPMCIA